MAGPDQAAKHSSEVLNQGKKGPCPVKMAVGGFAIAAVVGYFVLWTKKKPEASSLDVAKVTSGFATPEHTRSR